jgi:hypothetical protein
VVALCRLPFVDAQTRRPALARDCRSGIGGGGSRRHKGTEVDASACRSDPKFDGFVKALGCDSGLSMSTVTRTCADSDPEIGPVRQGSLGHTTFRYVFLHAT